MNDEYNYGPLEHQMAGGTDRSEFDKVFDQIEAPEYPATCDNCGFEAANEYMDEHICDPSDDTPAAPERGEWRYVETRYSAEVALNDNLRLRAHWTGTWDRDEIRTLMQGVVTEHNQHSILIAQRERLLAAIRKFVDYYDGANAARLGNGQARRSLDEFREVLTTSEQEGGIRR